MMENWDNDKFKIPHTPLQTNVFEDVKKRLANRRIEAQKTRRQMAAASVLLLVLAGVNVGVALSIKGLATKQPQKNEAEVLYDSYFNASKNMFNE